MALAGDILKQRIMGIDYGNKFSGTTVICYNYFHQVYFLSSSKNADADTFILSEAAQIKPDLVFMDAPLTLPGIYRLRNGYRDYFYRECDREMQAMSPMFLGGLTARAIKLKDQLIQSGFRVFETYPRRMLDIFSLPVDYYKQKRKDLDWMLDMFTKNTEISLNKKAIISWHHLDALLAFLSGMRYLNGESLIFGKDDEGLVYI
jgi:predicted nuclease with RNAse H fold